MLLHGHFQPLQRLQPQLRSFFHQHYLGGQEPTPGNIRVNEDLGPQSSLSRHFLLFIPDSVYLSSKAMIAPVQALELLEVEGRAVS